MPAKCFHCPARSSLHMAPKTKQFRDAWLAAIPNITAKELDGSNFRLCSLHFTQKYQTTGGRLSRNAVPTKFMIDGGLWYEVEFGQPSLPKTLPTDESKSRKDPYTLSPHVPTSYKAESTSSIKTLSIPESTSCERSPLGKKSRAEKRGLNIYAPRTYKPAISKLNDGIEKTRKRLKQI